MTLKFAVFIGMCLFGAQSIQITHLQTTTAPTDTAATTIDIALPVPAVEPPTTPPIIAVDPVVAPIVPAPGLPAPIPAPIPVDISPAGQDQKG